MAKKKSGTKKTTAKKTASNVKSTAKPKSASKGKTSVKSPGKTVRKKNTEVSLGKLVLKQFETWKPDKTFSMETDRGSFTAPPFFEDKEKAKQISILLFKKFDMKSVSEKAEPVAASKRPATPKKEVCVKNLVLKKFDVWHPETLFSVKPDTGDFTAPPLFEDQNKAKQAGKLLFQTFDLKSFPKAAAKPAAPKKAVSLKEMILTKFGQWQPDTLFSVKPDTGKFTAPPLFDDQNKAKQAGKLLFQAFDLKSFPKAAAKPAAPKKAVSLKELILTKFGQWQPETLFNAKPDTGKFTAPPLFEDQNKAKQAGKLLFQTFDLKSFPKTAAKPAPAKEVKPAAPKKVVSLKELILMKFGQWQPETLFSVKPDTGKFTAPPLFDDQNKTKQAGKLLFQTFDLKSFPKKAEEKPAPVKAAPAAEEPRKVCACKTPPGKKTDSADPMIKLFITCFIILLTLITSASYSNISKYYVQTEDGIMEIRQGKFAPRGEDVLVTLSGVKMDAFEERIYSKKEISHMLVKYFGNITSRLNEPLSRKNLKESEAYLKAMASVVSKRDMKNTFKTAAGCIHEARQYFERDQVNFAEEKVKSAKDLLNYIEGK